MSIVYTIPGREGEVRSSFLRLNETQGSEVDWVKRGVVEVRVGHDTTGPFGVKDPR